MAKILSSFFFSFFLLNSLHLIFAQVYHCTGEVNIYSNGLSFLSGTLASQINDTAYIDYETCFWNFIGDSTQTLFLTFNVFGLETNWDFLSIYLSSTEILTYKFSGYVLPENISILSLPVTIEFKSDELITGPGFELNYYIGACPNKCSGNGICMNGACVCEGGWMGTDCSISYCPNNCSPYGVCINGSFCQCDVGYYGGDCLKATCDKFNLLTAASGTFRDQNINRDYVPSTSCSWLISPPSVSAIHLSFLRLQIDQGSFVYISGNSVSIGFSNVVTPPNLFTILNSNALVQFITDAVYQRSGFELSYTTESCPSLCSGNGVCNNGTCLCFLGYQGSACDQFLSCPNGCSGNGKCLNGTCECNSNSVGLDCSGTIDFNCYTNSLTAPSNLLTINVSCNYSINVPNADSYLVRVISIAGNPLIFTYIPSNILYATFSLSNYSSPIVLYSPSISISGRGFGSAVVQYETYFCPNHCSGNGFCYLGRCICNFGFEGSSCNQNYCPNNCSNHGVCESNICKCNIGYYGIDCSSTFCSGLTIINQSSGIFADHDHEFYSQYLPNSFCQWLIINPNGNPFGFAFEVFQTNENNDWVSVFDGDSTSSSLLINASGSWTPSPIQSSGSSLLIQFQTNANFQYRGLIATFTDITFCPNSCSNNGVCNQGVCDCNPTATGNDCSKPINGIEIFLGETVIIELSDWKWQQYYVTINTSVYDLVFFFNLLSSNGDSEFYFSTNQKVLGFNDTGLPYFETPYVIGSGLPGVYWIGVYSRHIEASTGSVSSLLVYGCLNDCYGGGLCNSGVCLCEASGGYYGQYCQFSNCSNPCQNGGICVGINVCNCTNGYFGSYCQLFTCDTSCGQGTCIGPNACSCGTSCNLASGASAAVQGILIAVVILLGFAIISLGFLIFYMVCLKRSFASSNQKMGLAGIDELHDT